MAVTGVPRSFHRKFKFSVEIPGLGRSGFQKCSELSAEIAKIEYYEGGSLIPYKLPGRMSFSDITLERGATQDRSMFDLFSRTANAASGLGDLDRDYIRDGAIVQHDRDGSTLRRWSIFGAWVTKFVAGDWDNTSDEVVIESVTMTYDHFTLEQ